MPEIKELLQKIAKEGLEVYSVPAKVTEVDEDTRTIDVEPLNGDPEIFGVNLQADPEQEDGIVLIPTKDSTVLVTFLDNTRAFVSLFSQVDKVLVDIEEYTFNGGDNGGLINIEDLVTKLNNVENKVNTLLTTLKSITVPLAPSGSVPFAPFFSSVTDLTTTSKSDLEDDKIKH